MARRSFFIRFLLLRQRTLLSVNHNMSPTTTVFSYGSNSLAQLQARVQNPALIAHPAKLLDWERIFCVRAATWGGAAASLIPRQNGVVYGSAAQLTDNELSRLDSFEGGYHKEQVVIDVWTDGKWASTPATVYIANSLYWTVPPSKAYLTAIHINLREQFGELMPECANQIHVYGVFHKHGNENVSTFRSETAIGHDNGQCDMSADANHPERELHPVAAARTTDVLIERLSTWTYRGSEHLSLPALCVEVNALRKVKWVMPRAIQSVLKELEGLGVRTTPQLAVALGRGLEADLEYVDADALSLFRVLLRLD